MVESWTPGKRNLLNKGINGIRFVSAGIQRCECLDAHRYFSISRREKKEANDHVHALALCCLVQYIWFLCTSTRLQRPTGWEQEQMYSCSGIHVEVANSTSSKDLNHTNSVNQSRRQAVNQRGNLLIHKIRIPHILSFVHIHAPADPPLSLLERQRGWLLLPFLLSLGTVSPCWRYSITEAYRSGTDGGWGKAVAAAAAVGRTDRRMLQHHDLLGVR